MKKICLVLAALPVLVVAACGGITDGLSDLGVPILDLSTRPADLTPAGPDLAPPADLSPTADLAACTAPTIYRVSSGLYPAVLGSGVIVSDTCVTGIMGSQLETTRQVSNNGMGEVSISSADNTILVGKGPVRCNAGTLTNGPLAISDGVCRFTANYNVDLLITADNTFEMVVTQTRSGSVSEAGQVCNQPSTCAVRYKAKQKM